MLAKFAVKNFKNFNDWFEFDLSKTKDYEFNTDAINNGIVKTALIYGYNGTGKSNLGLAIFDIVAHLTDKEMLPDKYKNYTNADSGLLLSEFRYEFKFGEDWVKYEYGKYSLTNIAYENLLFNGQQCVSYDKRKQNEKSVSEVSIKLVGTENLNKDALKDVNDLEISVLKYIRANAILTDKVQKKIWAQFISFIDRMLIFWNLDERHYIGYMRGGKAVIPSIGQKDLRKFEKFLRNYGFNQELSFDTMLQTIRIHFKKRSIDFWENISAGMRSLTFFYFWLQCIEEESAVDQPSFIFFDEFDAFYHKDLAEGIIELARSFKNNQTIFTTHHTALMSNYLLRPDCYYFIYKGKIKSLIERADRELREGHNLEKMYRDGVFDNEEV